MDGSRKYTETGSLLCDEDCFLEDDDCKVYKKQPEPDSTTDTSNKSCTTDAFGESSSGSKDLRGDNDEEIRLLEKEIEEKKLILKLKRQAVCDRLMRYKLMEFGTSPDIPNIKSVPTSSQTEFKVPHQVHKQADSETASTAPVLTDSISGNFAGDINDHNIKYGFSEEKLIQMAIQASLDDMTKSQAASPLSPISEHCYSASGSSSKAQNESRNQSYPEGLQNPSTNMAGSSISSKAPVSAANPLHCPSDTETQNQYRETGDNAEDINPVQEDFMEGERYVGDKGKRPLSGRYSYKKRSKTSQADYNEQPPSGLAEKDRSAE